MRGYWIWLCFGVLWLNVAQVQGKGIGNFSATPEELMTLPGYCRPKANKDGNNMRVPEVKYWSDRIGSKVYSHIHHYCHALVQIQHYLTSDRNEKVLVKAALNNVNYSLERTSPKHALYPELLLTKGYIYEVSQQYGKAVETTHDALVMTPNSVRSYVQLSRIYLLNQQPQQAIEVLERGVKQTQSDYLQQRLQKYQKMMPAIDADAGSN
ncbi:tetratricopeptide repeat protein [Motilimonas sp. KMU-193]|uniref:tetratricopeptide repeat protein n=1 Tax=Motilimonas sp. KMU-193 TaxID=3388668 RepID=UPI00396B0769